MISPDKKRNLIFVYVTQGYSAAKPLAIEYGVSPRIMARYTREMGLKNKRGRETIREPRRVRPDRWKRAIAIGSLSR